MARSVSHAVPAVTIDLAWSRMSDGKRKLASLLKRHDREEVMKVNLLTKELRRKLPPIGGQEDKGLDAIAFVKFFAPDFHWTWYATEFDGQDSFFGFVKGDFDELGFPL